MHAHGGAGRQVDVLIADTSGRLHTNVNLMKELEKVKGVFDKVLFIGIRTLCDSVTTR
jgi:hypothetical protein